ncbi:6-bladed beta-propeller [Halosquirtibacter xylanolyticus]|uniref:6-bladed beta-propeller n=1 Tax=Halosquirtibacter xylanolyticus TaxID=3374599 RepID=UPI003748B4A7|nr:6-bladed beta-propeller [Prolixibacteraceae bacterium]
MNKRTLICTLIALLMFASCHEKQVDSTEIIEIDVMKASRVKMKDIFSKIELIPLETSENSLIEESRSTIGFNKVNDRYYIGDRKQKNVIVFGANGKHLYSSNQRLGRGPEEFPELYRYLVRDDNGNIIIYAGFMSKLFEYDIDGNFIDKYNVPKLYTTNKMMAISKDTIAFYCSTPRKNDNSIVQNALVFYSLRGEKIIKKIDSIYQDGMAAQTNRNCFQRFNDSISFNHNFPSNEIYRIDPNSLEVTCKYRLDFGEYNWNSDKGKKIGVNIISKYIRENCKNMVMVGTKLENSEYLIVMYSFKGQSNVLFYNKKSKRIAIKENPVRTKELLLRLDYIDEEYIYGLCTPKGVRNLISPDLLDDSLLAVLDSIKMSDNPIVVKYKFKKTFLK